MKIALPSYIYIYNYIYAQIVGNRAAARGRGSKHCFNRKRPFIQQFEHAKRRRLNHQTGIPASFLPAKLAARFESHVRNTSAILHDPSLRRGADRTQIADVTRTQRTPSFALQVYASLSFYGLVTTVSETLHIYIYMCKSVSTQNKTYKYMYTSLLIPNCAKQACDYRRSAECQATHPRVGVY